LYHFPLCRADAAIAASYHEKREADSDFLKNLVERTSQYRYSLLSFYTAKLLPFRSTALLCLTWPVAVHNHRNLIDVSQSSNAAFDSAVAQSRQKEYQYADHLPATPRPLARASVVWPNRRASLGCRSRQILKKTNVKTAALDLFAVPAPSKTVSSPVKALSQPTLSSHDKELVPSPPSTTLRNQSALALPCFFFFL
jgi:hypothetical protein